MAEILKVEKLCKRYHIGEQTINALSEVTFSLDRGEMLVIMGASGSGKTTLMNILGAMDFPDSGKVYLEGKYVNDFFKEPMATTFRREKIGYVFQQFNLLKDLSAFDNVALPLYLRGVAKNEIDRRVNNILDLLSLGGIKQHRPNELSGGQQQRVAIARAIVTAPPVLLADEPTGNLDYSTSHNVMNVFKNINETLGQSCIIVTHDPSVALYAKRLVVLRDGRIASVHQQEDNNRFSIDFVLEKLKEAIS